MARPAAACLLLAALSLLGPSEPSYDPWAWLVWGREIGHLALDTTGGPSWKPLPVALTTVFAPLSALDERIPPALWVLVARAGGLFALLMAFRLAGRLAGGPLIRRSAAGAVAVLALALTPEWIRYMVHGNEAPLAVGLALLAVDRHLDGHAERRPRGRGSGVPPASGAVRVPAHLRRLPVVSAGRGAASWSSRHWRGSPRPGSSRRGGARGIRSPPSPRPAASPPGACRSGPSRGGRLSTWRKIRPGSCSSCRRSRPPRWRVWRCWAPACAWPGRPAGHGHGPGRSGRGQRGALRCDDGGGVLGQRPLRPPGGRARGRPRWRGRRLCSCELRSAAGGRPPIGGLVAAAVLVAGAAPEVADAPRRRASEAHRVDRASRLHRELERAVDRLGTRIHQPLRSGDRQSLLPDPHGLGAVDADRATSTSRRAAA